MNSFGKLVMKMGVLSLLSVLPLAAQIDNAVTFTAPFPFYAGNVKLPAGSYTLTEPNMNTKVVLIRNSAGTKGDFINFIPTSSAHPQGDTDVTFHKSGDTGYLEGLSIAGETDGIEFEQTKAEAKAETTADNTAVVEHATLVSGE
jgi:hypothetical protein